MQRKLTISIASNDPISDITIPVVQLKREQVSRQSICQENNDSFINGKMCSYRSKEV